MPAPISPSCAACSKMRTWKPRFIRQAATASPPSPAPAMRTLPFKVHPSMSKHGRAAIDDQCLAGHERGVFAREETHRADQVFRHLVALDGARHLRDLSLAAMQLDFRYVFRKREARGEGIDRD